MRRLLALLLLLAAWPAVAQDCASQPLGGRDLYLRGTFNSWNAAEAQRFVWICNRFELVTRIDGEHRFKVADEGWSDDAAFGGSAAALTPRGGEISDRFEGVQRFMVDQDLKTLSIQACPKPAPFGDTALFLRGTMNNWAALDDNTFRYHCDAYLLNVTLKGRHEFKVADAAWTRATTFGVGAGNHAQDFSGAHTIRLSFDDSNRASLSVGPKSFADPRAQSVSDPVAQSLVFDSRDGAHKSPFGAVVTGTGVDYVVTATPGVRSMSLVIEARRLEGNQEVLAYREIERVPMLRQASSSGRERWAARYRFDATGIYGIWFEAEIGGRRFGLQNNRDPVYWTREKGSGGRASVGELPAASSAAAPMRRFRQTVYAADFQVPDWAPDIVYYYVFPERFRNGDRSNDPRPGVAKFHDKAVERHANWLDRPWRPGSGDGSDAVHNNDFFGGDLAGLIDKLDHIRELGANTIYMTPVFQAASNHKYDTADYRHIDPGFGTNEDFERLTREAKQRGIRILLDTSLNHTGSDSVYFDRFGHRGGTGAFAGGRIQPASPYADWYRFDANQVEPDKQYQGWVGVTDLPELNKDAPSFRAFAYGDADSVMKTWLDHGAAGWRMDVAPWVSDDFWRAWRSAIKQHRPDALTVAETWFDASKYFLGDMFDSTMNYIFRNTVLDYAAGGDAAALYANLEHLREAYPPQALFAAMNLLSTHDQARALHHFSWRHQGDDAATVARAKQRLRLAVFFQMTYPGAPTVYYGDEVGVTGGDDPDNRATYPWADLGGRPDLALRDDFRRLIQLRHDHAVLRRGRLDAPIHQDKHLIVLARQFGERWAITATNNAERPLTVTLTLPAAAPKEFVDGLTGAIHQAEGGRLTLTVPALFGSALLSR